MGQEGTGILLLLLKIGEIYPVRIAKQAHRFLEEFRQGISCYRQNHHRLLLTNETIGRYHHRSKCLQVQNQLSARFRFLKYHYHQSYYYHPKNPHFHNRLNFTISLSQKAFGSL